MPQVATVGSVVKALVWYTAPTAAMAVADLGMLAANLATHPDLAAEPAVVAQSPALTAAATAATAALAAAAGLAGPPTPAAAVALGTIVEPGTPVLWPTPTGLVAVEGANGTVTTLASVPRPFPVQLSTNLTWLRYFKLDGLIPGTKAPVGLVGGPVMVTSELPGSYGKVVTGCPCFVIN